jgi:hypothetical protein
VRQRTVVILLVSAFAGCGTSDEQQIRATIAAELRAYERQDWNAVCRLLTAAGRHEFLRTSLRPDAKTCADAWTPAPGGNEPILTYKFEPRKRRVTDVEVDNDMAHARYDDGSVKRFRKVRGRWLIDADRVRRAH